NLGFRFRWSNDLEELTIPVSLDIERDSSCRRSNAASEPISELQPCTHAGKLVVEQVGIHEKDDTLVLEEVRSMLPDRIAAARNWATKRLRLKHNGQDLYRTSVRPLRERNRRVGQCSF